MAEGTRKELTQDEINEARRKPVVERMYLNYFNDIFLKNGTITPRQHREMKNWITTRKVSSLER